MARGVEEGPSLLPVSEALDRVLAVTPVLAPEQVALAASLGRVLASDVTSDVDVPPFDRCAMDGHALRAADAAPGARLRVVGSVAAGQVFPHEVSSGCAVKVMTGAPLPPGCDAVEPLETLADHGDSIVLSAGLTAGRHVSRRAEDLAAGDVAVPAGTLVGPAHVALLATCGRSEVTVYGRPLAAIVSTGDELVEVGERPGPGKIRNSNGPMLAVLCRALGCDPVQLNPVVRDEVESLERTLTRALAADLLLISGGVSRGERDVVQDVLPALGVERIFHGVNIQPGKPMWFGRTDRCLVFGLPGNPVSALTTAMIFAGAAVRKMRGLALPEPRLVRARLSAPFRRRAHRAGWLAARVTWDRDGALCEPVPSRGSADLVAAAAANAFWIAPEGREEFAAGDAVDVLLHPDAAER